MIEPDTPTTIWIKQPIYPAFLLASDEGKVLKPSSIILRHRHLCQQQRIIQSGMHMPSSESASGRLARRTVVDVPLTDADGFESPGPSTSVPSPSSSSSQSQGLSSKVSDGLRQAVSSAARAGEAPAQNTAVEKANVSAEGVPSSPSSSADVQLFASARSKRMETSIGPLVVTHQERALRARGNKPHIRREKTVWYFSSSNQYLDAPPVLPDVSLGELYVHEGPDKQKQVWIWSTNSSWTSLQVAAPHPYLPDYILHFCGNGEPSWVTKETLRTYQGRIRKREATFETRQTSIVPFAE